VVFPIFVNPIIPQFNAINNSFLGSKLYFYLKKFNIKKLRGKDKIKFREIFERKVAFSEAEI